MKSTTNEIYNEAKRHFPETERIGLTFGIVAINGYNRINITLGALVGTYQPEKW